MTDIGTAIQAIVDAELLETGMPDDTGQDDPYAVEDVVAVREDDRGEYQFLCTFKGRHELPRSHARDPLMSHKPRA